MIPLHNDIRVLVVGESLLSRMGLSTLLQSQDNLIITAQASPDDLSTHTLEVYRSDSLVWLLGDDMPNLPNTDLGVPILFLLSDVAQAGRIWNVMRPFIGDHLPIGMMLQQPLSAERVMTGLSALRDGLMVIDPAVSSIFAVSDESDKRQSSTDTENLTPREMQVLQHMAEGLPNKQIARELGISPNTVKFHVNAILSKLDAQSRTEAVIRATQLGWVLL
ncbi:MAG: response regulator transcription factor [Anaerolineae bacterium]|nr:response regulator transcription factor [Anaerolineae bacterium]